MTKTIIFFLLLLPYSILAQFTISGRVLNHDDSQPMANVSVFLNGTTIGATTTAGGVFKLQNIKPGKYELTVSTLGFLTFTQSIAIKNTDITLSAISLSPKVIALKEVKIKSGDRTRQSNLDLFRNEFLGTSDFARQCKLVNPELLDLDYDEKAKTLTGKSSDFLVIENNALGYRIKYLLSDFMQNNYDEHAEQFFYEGSVFFEELKGTPQQVEQWKKNREDVYGNSTAHFLRAALNNNLGAEGFTVLRFLRNPERPADSLINSKISLYSGSKEYRDSLAVWIKKSKLPKLMPKQAPVILTGEDIIAQTKTQGLYSFGCDYDALYVVYNKSRQYNSNVLNHLFDKNNTSSTLVFFNTPFAYFDGAGAITNPGSLTYSGVWANRRLAELLPANYEPPQSGPLIDSTLIRKIDTTMKAYNAGHIIEKAYLHFDKPYYAAGDTIYFKAYVTDASFQRSALSGVLYADLIGPANKISSSVKLKLRGGLAAGDFALPDTLTSGNYRLRAYTNLVRNAGENYFFDQYLYIINEPRKATPSGRSSRIAANDNQTNKPSGLKSSPAKIDVQFFPEGGNLVNGVSSKMAFKAITQNGLGAEIKGTITDDLGHQVSAFASEHLGMGTIIFEPSAGKKYKANVTYHDTTLTFDLPGADDTGYAMSVDNTDSLTVRIDITAGQQNHQSQVNLVAQAGGVVYDYSAGILANNHFTTTIPKDRFPGGIIQLTLLSTNGEPMNERLVFIKSHDQLNLKLSTEKPLYRTREKVKINLSAKDGDHQPAVGNFSVSIVDGTRVPVDEDRESTILSNLLLTSDLKGYVECPNYYFNNKNAKAGTDLDVLMLTQGYHRFEWRHILNGTSGPVAFGPENKINIAGTIIGPGRKPIPNGRVSLVSVSKVFFSIDTVADKDGKFIFDHLPLIDSMRYMIQATDVEVRKRTSIELDDAKPPKAEKNKNAPDANLNENADIVNYLNFSRDFHLEQIKQGIGKDAIILNLTVITEKRDRKYLKRSANLNGPGHANEIVTADMLPPGCPLLTDCLAGHLHGIQFVNGMPVYERMSTLAMIDGNEIVAGKENDNQKPDPSVADMLNTLSVSDIASVEIITDASLAAIYGVRGGGGVILVTTKKFDDVPSNAKNFKPKFAWSSPVIYYKARTFYSPAYEPAKTNPNLTDLRTTIYWNPNVTTDKNGNASFEFFNADTKGSYRIVVEGLDDNGHLGRQVSNYKVE